MNYNQFSNISCYEEFEIQCTLTGISKIDILKEIGHKINNYYFFISNDGIFNWFDLKGNHIEDPGSLKKIKDEYIPENITKCIIPNNITHIGRRAFSCCVSLTSITIPDSVKRIGFGAFSYCESLKEITIPDSVTSIDYNTFYNCKSLTSITIPNSVTCIDYSTFLGCESLTSITIPNSITNISSWAFSYCKSLTSITIPNSVTDICNITFHGCNALKEVIFKGRTLEEVKQMDYPFGIKDENVFKFS